MLTIGITPSLYGDERPMFGLGLDYTNAVMYSGALPVALPYTEDDDIIKAQLDAVDGIILSGGADISPRLYGEEPESFCGELCESRDRYEMALCNAALAVDKPILAICRGYQLLNAALGGALYQDIATQYSDKLFHPNYDKPRTPIHEIALVEGTRLHDIVGEDSIVVNSRHHQGVKTLGEGLVAAGGAPDGLIEAFELPDRRFVIGVQWHPESMVPEQRHAVKLFSAFLDACGD